MPCEEAEECPLVGGCPKKRGIYFEQQKPKDVMLAKSKALNGTKKSRNKRKD